jgi:RHS repeat-associated protein
MTKGTLILTEFTVCVTEVRFEPTRFTGRERDTESGLGNFGARYYGSNMGRLMSPDWSEQPDTDPYSEFENPQTLNLYSYGHNSPLVYNDPDIHDVSVCDSNGKCNTVSNEAYTAAQKGNNSGLNVRHLIRLGRMSVAAASSIRHPSRI